MSFTRAGSSNTLTSTESHTRCFTVLLQAASGHDGPRPRSQQRRLKGYVEKPENHPQFDVLHCTLLRNLLIAERVFDSLNYLPLLAAMRLASSCNLAAETTSRSTMPTSKLSTLPLQKRSIMPRTASAATFCDATVGAVPIRAACGGMANVAFFFQAAEDRPYRGILHGLSGIQFGPDELGGHRPCCQTTPMTLFSRLLRFGFCLCGIATFLMLNGVTLHIVTILIEVSRGMPGRMDQTQLGRLREYVSIHDWGVLVETEAGVRTIC